MALSKMAIENALKNYKGPRLYLPEAFISMLTGKVFEEPVSDTLFFKPCSTDYHKPAKEAFSDMTDDRKAVWLRRLHNTQRIIIDHQMITTELIADAVRDDFAPPFTNTFCTLNDAEFIPFVSPAGTAKIGASHVFEHNGRYDYLFLMEINNKTGLIEIANADSVSPNIKGCDDFPKVVFAALNSCKQIGIEKYPTTIKIKKFGIDRVKMDSVIYISPNQKTFRSPLSHVAVDWKTRWWVRGHWVKIRDNSLGKDRLGNRNLMGRTWRREHEKGNPDGLVKKQIRVVRSDVVRLNGTL